MVSRLFINSSSSVRRLQGNLLDRGAHNEDLWTDVDQLPRQLARPALCRVAFIRRPPTRHAHSTNETGAEPFIKFDIVLWIRS